MYKNISTFLWQIIKPYKYHYLVQIVAPIYSGFIDLIYFYSVKLFIDSITKEHIVYNELIQPIVIYFLALLTLNIIWRFANFLEWRSAPFVRREILLKSYDYVQHHSYNFFQNNLSGNIISKIRGILDAYDKLFSPSMIKDFCINSVMIISGVVSISFISMQLSIFMFFLLTFSAFVFYKITRRLDNLVFLETNSRHNIIGFITDKITNINSLFYFSSRKKELTALKEQITNDFIPKQVKVYKYDCILHIIAWAWYFILWSSFVVAIIQARQKNFITAGTIAFAFGMFVRISDAFWVLLNQLQQCIKLIGDFKASFEILRIPHDKQLTGNTEELLIRMPSIEFRDVYFNYGKTKVFEKLCLRIKPGENVGVVGSSGAGKTSLVNVLLKFFTIQSGDIFIDSKNIKNINTDSLWSNISVIPQDIMLFHRSLMENIRYGNPNATNEEIIKAAKHAHIHEFIESLPNKYNTSVGERGIKLSGGQRQRIAIARAILKNAPILILDEATSSLDSKTEKDIQASINYILEKEDQTVIAIAHRLSTLRHMDRIIVLDKGKIVEEGTHEYLMNKEGSLYQKLWHDQMIV